MKLIEWLLWLPFLAFAEGDGGATATAEQGEKTGDSETPGESPSPETEGEEQPGEGEKTREPSDEEVEKQLLDKGDDIPYERFKKVIDGRNAKYKSYDEELETLKTDFGELDALLKIPTVFRAILSSQGITDKKIQNERMREMGFETEDEVPQDQLFKQFTQDVDLNKQDGWFEVMRRMSEHYAKQAILPIQTKLSKADQEKFIGEQEQEATRIAKEEFEIEYGKSGVDEKNPNTAIGIMAGYLKKHPEDAYLGQVKILRLAMSEKGFKLGKQAGINKEKERNEKLRNSQMEGDAGATREEQPDSSWSVSKLLKYSQKHNK